MEVDSCSSSLCRQRSESDRLLNRALAAFLGLAIVVARIKCQVRRVRHVAIDLLGGVIWMRAKLPSVRPAFYEAGNQANRDRVFLHLFGATPAIGRQNYFSLRPASALGKFVILFCLLIMPCVAFAQTDHLSWENLGVLQVGQKIQVVEKNHKKDSGTFISFSDTTISLQEAQGQQTIQRQDVTSVKLMKRANLVRNAVIGGAVGAGIGAGVGAAAYGSCQPTINFCLPSDARRLATGIFALIGGAAGAIVGAVWPSHKTIFRVHAQ
jgi:hypothetical protein